MKKRQSSSKLKNLTHDEVPATVGLLKEVRDELRSDIRAVGLKVSSHDHKFESIDLRFESVEHKIESVRDELKSSIEELKVSVHRTQALMEEQRSENKIVLDGLQNIFGRQERIETDVESLKRFVGA